MYKILKADKVFLIYIGLIIIIVLILYIATSIVNPEYQEEPQEIDEITIPEGIHKDVNIKLKSYGFIEDNNCEKFQKCFSKDNYSIKYGNSYWLSINKNINSLTDYDCTDDLELIGNMYNNTDIKNRGNIINSLLKFTNDDSISFNVNIDSLHLSIHASNNYIIYNIDNKHVKDYKENAIDSFDIKNLNKINKDDIFKIILNNYEEEFPLYDFTNNYNKYSDKHNISFTIKDNYYIYTTTNGSNYKFDFDKEDKETQTSIKVEVPGIIFESDCINIIKNDLNYFNKKYDNNIKLTDEQIDEIKKAFSNDISIDLKDTIIIKIYNIVGGKYFIINYDITKKAID